MTIHNMTEGIEMDARMQGGLLSGLKRKFLAGESLSLTFFRAVRRTPTWRSARPDFGGTFGAIGDLIGGDR